MCLNNSLTNENSETFNFGVLNGVRGFFTNPSRADDSFIPFNRVSTGTFTMSSGSSTVQLGFKPKTVFVFNFSNQGSLLKMAYHSDDTPLNGFYDATSQSGGLDNRQAITPIDNGFIMTQFINWVIGTCYYYAW